MFGEDHYNQILKKLISGFGTLFNNIWLVTLDNEGNKVSKKKVPLIYSPKQSYYFKTIQDPNQDKQVAITYPMMGFDLKGLEMDFKRKRQSTLQTIGHNPDTSEYLTQSVPVPYKVDLELTIVSKREEDGFQIVEKILPYFVPSYTITAKLIPELCLEDDIPITLMDINHIDTFIGGIEKDRVIAWTLSFQADINIYGATRSQSMIREIGIDFLFPDGEIDDQAIENTPRSSRIHILPDPIDAEPDDDYDLTINTTEYNDNKKYNPVTGEDEEV